MPYQRITRPSNTIPDSGAIRQLGISRATFYRKLKEGCITSPTSRGESSRRWWTPADIECARQELSAVSKESV